MSDQLASSLTADETHQYDPHTIASAYTGHILKSVIDLTVVSLAFPILLPVFFVVAAMIKLDGGPVFYAHPRVGRGGRHFNCYKFRSMRVNSEEILARLLLSDPEAAEAWKTKRKLLNDPRVTSIGKFLRKTSIDELPQLLNVLRMDMSLVGPRPIVEQELHFYGANVHKYHACRPGLTGMWQVSGRSNTTFSERVALDVKYAENWSVWLDVKIIVKTVPAVLGGFGAR